MYTLKLKRIIEKFTIVRSVDSLLVIVGWKVASIKTGHYNHIAQTAHALKFNPELSNC